MPTVYLHIGYPKTGTTLLQNYFAQNRGVLRQKGILCPPIGTSWTGHHVLAGDLIDPKKQLE
jgi:hypothetical protein